MCISYPHHECPSSKSSCQFILRRSVATYPIRKEMGARSQRKVFTWSHSEPRSQALLRLSHYCGTRVHGKGSHCAPLFSPRVPRPARALKAGPPLEAGLFCVQQITKHHVLELARKGRDEHMPIDTVDIFGSDQVGIHLASVGGVLFHPPELPEPTVEILRVLPWLGTPSHDHWWIEPCWRFGLRQQPWHCRGRSPPNPILTN